MGARPVLDNSRARRLFLDRHALLAPPVGPAKGQALADLIHRLGFVQVDSVNTFARAHDLILWSRRGSYDPASLRWLNDRKRATFEHWTHDASIISMPFFPAWRLKFTRDRARLLDRWEKSHGPKFQAQIDAVLRHVQDHGSCCTRDVSGERAEKSTGWWDWEPSKVALEFLWRSGELAVSKRVGFRKFYDLTERVIPPEYLNAHWPQERVIDWACAAALDRLGFATTGELAAFFDLISPQEAKTWAETALSRGRLVEVDVENADGSFRRNLMWSDDLAPMAELGEPSNRMRILSPFDPALRDRKRAERLFGFHYRIEIFVPAAQRRYGYYVFPVLEADRLVGRIDMARDGCCLRVRAFWPEPGVTMGKGRTERLRREVERAADFGDCSDTEWEPDWKR